MAKTVIISGHPHLDQSLANKTILEELEKLLPEADIRYLDQKYPDGIFDVEAEQKALAEADTIVFQFPVYWYAYPALLKKYVEDVFTHGFAYGTEGTVLRGKRLLISCTVGSAQENYGEGKLFNHSMETFLFPAQQLAALCGMIYERPLCEFGMMYIPGLTTDEDKERIMKACRVHAEKLAQKV